jgi:hypothetical protein
LTRSKDPVITGRETMRVSEDDLEKPETVQAVAGMIQRLTSSLNTTVQVNKKLDRFLVAAQAKLTRMITIEVGSDRIKENLVDITLTSNEGEKLYVLERGDQLRVSHVFDLNINAKEHNLFPMTFDFKGSRYILNSTKNDKLILTKE